MSKAGLLDADRQQTPAGTLTRALGKMNKRVNSPGSESTKPTTTPSCSAMNMRPCNMSSSK
jgi:hypothetical protein